MTRFLHALINWMRQLFRGRAFEREMQAEMNAHLEQEAELHQARGMSRAEAMEAARRNFGNVSYLQEQSREARGTQFIEETKRDLLYGVRALLRTPGFTIVAILSLTLGIGVNTAMFTLLRYILAPQRVLDPSTYVHYNLAITPAAYRAITGVPGLFSSTFAYSTDRVALRREGKSPVETSVQLVTDGYFSVFDSRPLLGRFLLPGEERNNNPALAILSHHFWKNEFGGDSSIIGKTIHLTNNAVFEIVGVSRAEFGGASKAAPDVWLPLWSRTTLPVPQSGREGGSIPPADDNARTLFMSGRLAPGISLKAAQLRLINVLSQLDTADSETATRVQQLMVSGNDSGLNRRNAAAIVLLLTATLMVLLIGCANVANLVMARGVRRRREIAVRLSLGASRARLIRQLLTENGIIALIGGGVALLLDVVVLRVISTSELFQTTLKAPAETIFQFLRPDSVIITFTFATAFLSATASGLLPALRSTKMDLSSATRDDGSALGNRVVRSRLRTTLVIGQVALSLVLLISSSVLLRSVSNVESMDAGFDRKHLDVVSTAYLQAGISQAQHEEFGRSYDARLRALIGEKNVARGSPPILPTSDMLINANGAERVRTVVMRASSSYFDVLGIPLVRGRTFTESEARNHTPLVIISENGARKLWPTESALGKRITLQIGYPAKTDTIIPPQEATVIGVAKDAQLTQLDYTPGALVYLPTDTGAFLVRARDPEALRALLRDAARISDPDVLVQVQTGDDLIMRRGPAQGTGFIASGATSLGISALLLSVIGIFGVVAYAVSQRTREIGVRLAIGAQREDVLRMVIRQGMRPVMIGTGIGLVLATMFTRVLDAFLFGVKPFDPLGYLAATAFVGVAALLACYFPARRAMSVDPVGALRTE